MQKTVTVEGKDFVVRGLRRREVKQLRGENIDLANLSTDTGDEVMDRILDMVGVAGQPGFEDLFNANVMGLYREVMRLTFIPPDAEKNSSSPPTSTSKESSTDAAGA